MTSNLILPVSDFLAASGERWPITEAMTLSEEDRAALRDQVSVLWKQMDEATARGKFDAASQCMRAAHRLQARLNAAQVNP